MIGLSTDGMDQAKWALPRYKGLRPCKSLGSLKRPQLKIQGVWVYWFRLDFWVLDPDQPHDSSAVVECVARSLEGMRAMCLEKNLPVPTELHMWVRAFTCIARGEICRRLFRQSCALVHCLDVRSHTHTHTRRGNRQS